MTIQKTTLGLVFLTPCHVSLWIFAFIKLYFKRCYFFLLSPLTRQLSSSISGRSHAQSFAALTGDPIALAIGFGPVEKTCLCTLFWFRRRMYFISPFTQYFIVINKIAFCLVCWKLYRTLQYYLGYYIDTPVGECWVLLCVALIFMRKKKQKNPPLFLKF